MTSEEVEESIRGKTETYLKAKITIGLLTKHQPLDILKAAVNVVAAKHDMPNVAVVRPMTTQGAAGGTGKYVVVFDEPNYFDPDPNVFHKMLDVILPNGSYAELDWDNAVKAKFNLCRGKCNRNLQYDKCVCVKATGFDKKVKEDRKAGFLARLSKKRALDESQSHDGDRRLQPPPPSHGGAGSSSGRW